MYMEIKDFSEESLSGSENDVKSEFIPLKEKVHILDILNNAKLFDCVLYYGFIHGYMEQLFPANYSLFVNSLSMDPVLIGTAAFLQKVLFTIASPFWGLVIDSSEQIFIMKTSVISLTISTLLICFSKTINQFFLSMCFWGFFSAAFGPLSQKTASDQIEDNKRGKYFGKLMFYQSTGRLFALFFTGICSKTDEIYFELSSVGFWIFPFIFATLFGFTLFLYLNKFLVNQETCYYNHFRLRFKVENISNIKSMGYLLRSKIVLSLFLLGMVNSIPRSALNFIPMWLHSTGLSNSSATFVVSISWIAAIIVSPLVGYISDLFYRLYPSKGRIIMAQFSLLLRSVFLYLFIERIPLMVSGYIAEEHKTVLFSFISFIIGLFAGWPGIGACRPILCEVILPQHRATVFALSSTFEGIGAAFFGTRFVGDLAVSIFGYESHSEIDKSTVTNHTALGNAILCMTILPWLLSILLFYLISREQKRLVRAENRSCTDKNKNLESLIEIKTV